MDEQRDAAIDFDIRSLFGIKKVGQDFKMAADAILKFAKYDIFGQKRGTETFKEPILLIHSPKIGCRHRF